MDKKKTLKINSSFHNDLMPNINDKYDIQKQKMLNRPRADSISKESEITTFVLLTLKTLWPYI
jgi:hypothetical protein